MSYVSLECRELAFVQDNQSNCKKQNMGGEKFPKSSVVPQRFCKVTS